MHIVGTAGHVDHGKSSLVAALTGTHPDRWLEERLRGMTLDLGFAHLQFDDGLEAGIVDVPGHERFLHNMLAGAAGMEVLLLVVAANEGVMPQTIEHLQILRFLNVQRVVVALTKADLVDAADLPEAMAAVRSGLHGTIAQDAPIFAVSTVSGSGMAAIREALSSALRAIPARRPDAPVYLPVDRVFTVAGRGTIVTGTLMQGSIAPEDAVFVQPSGKRLRVRSLQVFGASRKRADGGTRIALNLPGIERTELSRGDVIAGAEFAPQSSFSVRFTPLESSLALLRKRMPVRAHLGSAEILGTLVFERVPVAAAEVRAKLHLRTPTLAFPGVRWIARRVSPKTLLGGGEIERIETTAASEGVSAVENVLLAILRERGVQDTEAAQAAFLANLRDDVAREALSALADRGEIARIGGPEAYVDASAARDLLVALLDECERHEKAEPWSLGMTSLALARALGRPEPLLIRLLAAYDSDGRIMARGGYYATPGYVPTLTTEQRAFFERVVRLDPSHPHVPVSLAAVGAEIKGSSVAGVAKAYDALVARGALVKVGDNLYRGTQIAAIHAKIAEFFARERRMTMAQFRDTVGTSRKYAVPLLEWFDSRRITIRDGDYRTLRKGVSGVETAGSR